jgi:hypothetical protein
MTKAYRIELLVIDHDELGSEEIVELLENHKYPNYCISPKIMSMDERDIGEWTDDHPLNKSDTQEKYYNKRFNEDCE